MWRPEGINQERTSQCTTLPEDIDQEKTGKIMDASVEDDARGVLCCDAERKGQSRCRIKVPDAMPSLEVCRPKKGSWLWSVSCWAKTNLVLCCTLLSVHHAVWQSWSQR